MHVAVYTSKQYLMGQVSELQNTGKALIVEKSGTVHFQVA